MDKWLTAALGSNCGLGLAGLVGNKVLVARPARLNRVLDASELAVTGRDTGDIVLGASFAGHDEKVRRVRNGCGKGVELRLAAAKLVSEGKPAKEMEGRCGDGVKRAGRANRAT